MPRPVRVFHIFGDQFAELETQPEQVPTKGYLWIATTRGEFEAQLGEVQGFLQRWTGTQLYDLHVIDLLNRQLPSTYDYTSDYDLLVFRRLAAGMAAKADDGAASPPSVPAPNPAPAGPRPPTAARPSR